jgi:hypothetical protein
VILGAFTAWWKKMKKYYPVLGRKKRLILKGGLLSLY